MYRQIRVQSSHLDYQYILWCEDPSLPLLEYALSTVTCGVSSSPYQAILVLHQLEKDEGHNFPVALGVLSSQTYVDDIITGAETVENALLLQKSLVDLLARGKLELKKWTSNCSEVLRQVPMEDRVMKSSFEPKDNVSVKILGLHWDPVVDAFSYHCEPFTSSTTKRSILSTIATIFDPLGILSPVTFWAKNFMQLLWKDGYDWDQPLTAELSSSWKQFSSDLPYVSSITQPPTVHLLTAKSKVSPLKLGKTNETLSIPRLELCGALLLAQILNRVEKLLSAIVPISSIHAWTDSTVVLSWLIAQPVEFKVFVTNRLKKISELIPSCQWHYISTLQNPADCVSRGMFPREMLVHNLYWDGPDILKQSVSDWSSSPFKGMHLEHLPERKLRAEPVHIATIPNNKTEWLSRFSTLTRLQRVLVYMRQYIAFKRKLPYLTGYIRQSEIADSMKTLVKITQAEEFHATLKCLLLSNHSSISKSLARHSPFVDIDEIIRVGGCLRNSNATEDFKHPMLLAKSSILTTLVIRHYHINHFHAGPQLVSSLIAVRFWIISSRSVIRKTIFKCVTCARHRSVLPSPIRGDLPGARICQVRPFSNVGIDYAGPIMIKESRRRNARSSKGYLAIFVCMAVKAVHIEVVTDLTTAAFIAALNRFVSRRGIPANIYSDCGSNFKGADTILKSLFQHTEARDLLSHSIPCHWHFNPPASPHFGGSGKLPSSQPNSI